MSSTMTKGKTSKQISCKVRMLDDQELPFHIDPKATGQDLLKTVANYIDLLETDYFALEYLDSHRNACWLEMDKPVLKQVTETKFSFCVKFYTPDPGQLEEEFTRYLFALQIKRDLNVGTLLCSDNTAALLASYIVQAEIGDYLETYNNSPSYLGGRKFFPHQTTDHEIRIMNFHKNHVGQLPADADLNLLDIARKVELYGIKMHPAKDHEQVNLNLSVAHMGILVFQNITKINTFSWAKIRKLSFKRKKFLIKLQPEGYGYYKDTVEFYFDTRDECKNFWKKCIEYHAFFRCVTIKRAQRSRSKLLTRGSSFRYNGRTQKEIVEYAREHYMKNRTFARSYSNTRAVAPTTGRSLRSPTTTLRTSDTMRSQDTTKSSTESTRNHTRPVGLPTAINQQATTTTAGAPDATLSTTPNDVYRDDYSSTHGSRTLDSRFSRDKYDLSDAENTDDEEKEEEQETENAQNLTNEQTQKTTNGTSSLPTATSPATSHPPPPPENDDKHITDIERSTSSKPLNELDEVDKGKSMSTEQKQQYRREISGFVNHHRPVPSKSSNTPPRRSSVPEQHQQHVNSVGQRLSLSKQISMKNNEHVDTHSPIKRSPIKENKVPSPSVLTALVSKIDETTMNDDDDKTQTIPVIHEYHSPTTTLSKIESRTTTIHEQSPSRTLPLASHPMSPAIPGTPRLIGTVPITSLPIIPTSVSSTMIISSVHDHAFFICKEFLMTERTYKKDIEVIADSFRRELMLVINQQTEIYIEGEEQQQQYNFENDLLKSLADLLFTHLVPIHSFHSQFLRQLEQRISIWESRSVANNESFTGEKSSQHIGDVIVNLVEILPKYENYVENYDRLLTELEYVLKRHRRFDLIYKEFESQKFCYLSFISFLLKPLQRLLHYAYLLEKLLLYYRQHNSEVDYQDCYGVYIKIQDYIENFNESLTLLQNRQKVIELQRDLIGVDNLSIQHDRQFIREGCLQKLSRKGYQQRMFFLFSDVLLYCARSSSPVLQFKLHGELPLKLMTVEDSDERTKIPNSITIYTGTRSLLVAASSEMEKKKWLHDLKSAIDHIKINVDEHRTQYTSTLKSNASSENLDYSVVGTLEDEQVNQVERSCIQHRANTTMHVCWHRNLSVSIIDHQQSIKSQLSGYLLRKFKNSNGWQKLWVVFTNFCLFFYKTYQDDYPLASLPLLGYRTSLPSETDGVNKDFVFKLQFKNHVYFFRAESQYAFDRWVEVVSSATISSTNVTID